ncbi:MAG: winged helix-turn-helix domain-containing protein [Phycisphaerales bacterium]|nr:winged helix-turn-helix domain-containing protein [Phycisphaerales bacterium]
MPSKKKTSVRASAKSTNKDKTKSAGGKPSDLDKGRAAALATLTGSGALHEGEAIRGDGKKVKVSVPADHADAPGPDPTAPEVVPPADAADAAAPPTLPDGAADAKPTTPATPARKRHVGPGGKRIAAPKPANEPKAKKEKTPKPPKVKKVSCLDAAAQVLAASEVPMKATDMIAAMEAKGLWKTGKGLTPEATLYAAIIREIAAKGREARFKKHDRGLFVAGKGAN